MNARSPIHVMQLGSPTGLYGAERWILALVRRLDAEKVRSTVSVVKDAPGLEAPLCGEARKLGIRTHVFEVGGRANLFAVKRVREFILENRVDVLHTHWYKADLIGRLATLGTKCRIVTTPHGWSNNADAKVLLYERLARCTYPFLDAAVPLSEDLFRDLRGLPGMNGKLSLIRNGVDTGEIESQMEIADDILAWKKEGAVILGYIGQLIPRKGVDVLLKAVSRLSVPNWRLAIVGEGESRARLEMLARSLGLGSRVRFFGFRSDRLSFLRGFDVFILPSRLEGIPRCVMEAMTAGVPVIASDIEGCRDLVSNEGTGLLFRMDDDLHLARQLARLMEEPGLAGRVAKGARALIADRFSAERMAREYENFYMKLNERRGRAHGTYARTNTF